VFNFFFRRDTFEAAWDLLNAYKKEREDVQATLTDKAIFSVTNGSSKPSTKKSTKSPLPSKAKAKK